VKRPYDRENPPGEVPETNLVRYKKKNPATDIVVVETPISMDLVAVPRRADEHPVAVYLANLAPGSRRTMKQSLEVVAKMFDRTILNLRWQDLRYQHVQFVRSRLAEHYAPNTANKILTALRGVLHEAKKLGLMSAEDYMNARDIKAVKGKRVPKGRALTEEEIKKLFSVLDCKTLSGTRDTAMLAVMISTGVRRNELTGLMLKSYNKEEKTIFIRGKGNKERVVNMKDATLAIEKWLVMRGPGKPEDPLFLPIDQWGHIFPRRLSDLAITFRLEDIAEKADVKKFAAHDMRRTFITRLLDAGADMGTVRNLAGHEDMNTTAKYDRRDDRAKKAAVELLPPLPYNFL
jgi:site-specific recombinase XerD